MFSRNAETSPGGMARFIARIVVRFVQLVMAVTVIGLYGTHIDAERKAGQAMTPSFLYALVIGGISVVTTAVYGIPFVRSRLLFAWDAVLFILWIAVFGLFAQLFLHRGDAVKDEYQNTVTSRMKHAVWVDLVNCVLWLITATYGAISFFRERRAAKLMPAMAEIDEV